MKHQQMRIVNASENNIIVVDIETTPDSGEMGCYVNTDGNNYIAAHKPDGEDKCVGKAILIGREV